MLYWSYPRKSSVTGPESGLTYSKASVCQCHSWGRRSGMSCSGSRSKTGVCANSRIRSISASDRCRGIDGTIAMVPCSNCSPVRAEVSTLSCGSVRKKQHNSLHTPIDGTPIRLLPLWCGLLERSTVLPASYPGLGAGQSRAVKRRLSLNVGGACELGA